MGKKYHKKTAMKQGARLAAVMLIAVALAFSAPGYHFSTVYAWEKGDNGGQINGSNQDEKASGKQGEPSDSGEEKSKDPSPSEDKEDQSETGEDKDSESGKDQDSSSGKEEKTETAPETKENDKKKTKDDGSGRNDSKTKEKGKSKDTKAESSTDKKKEDQEEDTEQESIPNFSGSARIGMTSMQAELVEKLNKKIRAKKRSIKKKEAQVADTRTRIERLRTLLIECSSVGRSADHKSVIIGTKRDHAGRPKENVRSGIDNKLSAMAKDIEDRDLLIWTRKYTVEKGYDPIRPAELPEDLLSNASPLIYQCIADQKGSIAHEEKQIKRYEKQIEKLREERAAIGQPRVFDPSDVTIPSNFTVEEIESLIGNTNMGYLSRTFVQCEEDYGVNAIFLISIAAHESAWGSSRRARQDHNYTGYGVSSSSSRGINADRGEDNIRTTAEALANNYLSPGGRFYKGVSVSDVNKTYCATGGWTGAVVSIADNLMARILN